jgi:hypothetical protein
LLPKTVNPKLWHLIIERLAFALIENCHQASHLLNSLNDRALALTVNKLQRNIKDLPQQFVSNLTRHKSPNVRQAAARAILENDPENFHALCAHLALDPDPTILKLVRPTLAKKRSPLVENILLPYLRQNFEAERFSQDKRLIDVYRLLGHCASSQALPFLEEALMKISFKGILKKNFLEVHKVGSALALMLMNKNEGAASLLQRAERSSFKSIRSACQEAERLTGNL